MIFGAGNRLRPDGPYLDLYREFKDVLAEDRQVIVIGYSFRDAHVNEAVRRWVLEHGQEGALLRIGSLTDVVPPIVNRWMDERELDLEIVPGPAEKVMRELLAPRPRLMSPS